MPKQTQTDLTYKSPKPDIWHAYKQLLSELAQKPATPVLAVQAQKLSISSSKTIKQSLANLHQLLDNEVEQTISNLDQINQTLETFAKIKQNQQDQIESDRLQQITKLKQEEEEFLYEFNKHKRNLNDELQQTKQQTEADINKRQQELSQAEDELKHLRKLAETIDEKIIKAVDEAVKQNTTDLGRNFEHQQALKEAQSQAQISLLEQKITSLEKENAILEKELKASQQFLTASNTNLTRIAQSAVSRQEKPQSNSKIAE